MTRFLLGFSIALLISAPLAGQQNTTLQSRVHLQERDVPWPAPISGNEREDTTGNGTMAQDFRRLGEVMRWKTLIGTGGRFGEGLPDPDIGFGVGELGPGAIYPAHRHPAPELYYFISGSAKWNVDGEEFIATPGSTVYMKPNAVHSLEIISEEKAVVVWADWSPNGDMDAMQGGYELLEHVPEQPERARINVSD
jgi:quercetin dioxygenase-like cupin family protein